MKGRIARCLMIIVTTLLLAASGGALSGCGSAPAIARAPENRQAATDLGPHSLRMDSAGVLAGAGSTGWDPNSAVMAQLARPEPALIDRIVPPQSRPAPGEELWVISRPDAQQAPPPGARDEAFPGTGALATRDPRTQQLVPIPLKHTDVKADIAGYIATVDVTQQFQNPYDGKIEAVYVFPLPHNAAVNEFVMIVGDRKIRGIIRERQEAEQIYQAARAHGHVASLLTQERPNVFTQKVANIEPGKRIDISIRYFNTLSYADGSYEFVFPMVVGPRFNPPSQTDGVGAVGVGSRGASGQKTEVQYLRPEQRSGHDIALSVRLNAGVAVEDVKSANHRVSVAKADAGGAMRVDLDKGDAIPNKDFVLRYKVAGEDVKPGLIAHRGKDGTGYFTLMLFPPADLGDLPRQPLEMFFTLDVSGSMAGAPIEQSKAAMRYALRNMRPQDTFQIVLFAGDARTMSPAGPVPATRENVREAMRFMEQTDAGGGTMMLEGIRASLEAQHDESRPRFVAFLTDGYIGNETEILGELHRALGPSRVFSFGVGSSPNRYLLDHMAKLGRGAVAYLDVNDRSEYVMAHYFQRITHPALTDVSIDWGGMQAAEVFPQRLPDLFVGRPVILTGKFRGDGNTTIKVSGKVGGRTRQFEIPVKLDDPRRTHAALPPVWARMKIADLAGQSAYDPNAQLPQQVKQVAMEYGLMSAYTAFVAVDATSKTAGDHGTSVAVPVPVPDGVRYETTVQDRQAAQVPGPVSENGM